MVDDEIYRYVLEIVFPPKVTLTAHLGDNLCYCLSNVN
jgi:hypothetical protein